MSGTSRLKAAVIGCGKMAHGHAHAYVSNDRVDLVACADISEGAREGFAREFNIPTTYADPAEMLAAEQPDFVSICTWPPLHAELVELAASHGVKGIWCEKPMAVHLAECDRMIEAARKAGSVLIVSHQRRYIGAYNAAKDLIADGAIGELVQISGFCGGDALTDGTHLIDMTRWLNNDNPVTQVFGAIDMTAKGSLDPNGMGTVDFNATRTRYGHHVETGSMAILFFENGVRGHLEIGSASRPGYQRFVLDGTDGRIELSGDQAYPDGTRMRLMQRGEATHTVPETDVSGAMEAVLADLIASVETGASHRLSGESGREDQAIVMAIYESARQRNIVPMPVDLPESPLEAMLAAGEIALN